MSKYMTAKARRWALLVALGVMAAALVDIAAGGGSVRVTEATPTPTPARTQAEEVRDDVAAQEQRYSDEGSGAERSSRVPDPAATAELARDVEGAAATTNPVADWRRPDDHTPLHAA